MYTHVLYRLRESSGRIPNSSSQCFTQKVWNRERKIPFLIYMLHLLTFRSYFVMMFFNKTLKKTFKSFPWFPSEWGLSPSSGSTQPCRIGVDALSHGFPTEGTTLALTSWPLHRLCPSSRYTDVYNMQKSPEKTVVRSWHIHSFLPDSEERHLHLFLG